MSDKAPNQAPPPAEEQARMSMSFPSDPILRFVLIEKGVISPDDLTAAEQQLLATGILGVPPTDGG